MPILSVLHRALLGLALLLGATALGCGDDLPTAPESGSSGTTTGAVGTTTGADTTTGGLGLAGTPDGRWDNEDLSTLRSLDTGDLEVIDASSLMVREDSMSVDPTG